MSTYGALRQFWSFLGVSTGEGVAVLAKNLGTFENAPISLAALKTAEPVNLLKNNENTL